MLQVMLTPFLKRIKLRSYENQFNNNRIKVTSYQSRNQLTYSAREKVKDHSR